MKNINENEVAQEVLNTENETQSSVELVNQLYEDIVSDDDDTAVAASVDSPLASLEDILTDDTFQQICDAINEMNIIEATKALGDLNAQKKMLDASKQFADSIKLSMKNMVAMKNMPEFSQNIAKANLENMTGMNKDIDEFLASYDNIANRLGELIKCAEDRVKQFDDVDKTTTYMNNAMLSIINNKLDLIEKRNIAFNHPVSIYYRTLKNIFTDRTNVDYILNKIPQLMPNINRVKRSTRDKNNGAANLENAKKFITDTLQAGFKYEQITAFTEYILLLFGNRDAAFYTMYTLATIYSNTTKFKKTGEHKWIEVLIMNVLDIITESYDFEGGREVVDNGLLKIKAALGY